MPAPARWWCASAAASRRPKPSSARFQASATIPPRPSRPSPSARGPRPSTAISSAWWRGSSPSPRRCLRPRLRSGRLPWSLTPAERAGDFAQAMMDLGRDARAARAAPACGLCPLNSGCAGHAQGFGRGLCPIARRSPSGRRDAGHAFVALREDGAVLLRERPLKGLLGGMLETPSSP